MKTSAMQITNPQQTPRFVSERDLAAFTGIKASTWQKHRLYGRGPKFYKLHGTIRYNLEEVLAWIESNAHGVGVPA
jgi:predicted DNA-binding transcriptional regulator AlpA